MSEEINQSALPDKLVEILSSDVKVTVNEDGTVSLRPIKSKWARPKPLSGDTLTYWNRIKDLFYQNEEEKITYYIERFSLGRKICLFVSSLYDAAGGPSKTVQLNKEFKEIKDVILFGSAAWNGEARPYGYTS